MRIFVICFASFTVSIVGCKPYSYFTSPNDFLNIKAAIYLLNGTEVDATMSVQFETGHNSDSILTITDESHQEKRISIDSIQYFKVNNAYYYPKILDMEAYDIPNKDVQYLPNIRNIVFLKRLTDDNARIQFYELYQSKLKSEDGQEHYSYYVSLPSDNRLAAWSLGSNKFFPKFEEKWSSIVSDCPSLSEKIRQKTSGYSLNQISVELKKYEVFKRIISEYNNCRN